MLYGENVKDVPPNSTKAEEGLPTSDFRLPTSDFRLPTSDFRLPTSDFMVNLGFEFVHVYGC